MLHDHLKLFKVQQYKPISSHSPQVPSSTKSQVQSVPSFSCSNLWTVTVLPICSIVYKSTYHFTNSFDSCLLCFCSYAIFVNHSVSVCFGQCIFACQAPLVLTNSHSKYTTLILLLSFSTFLLLKLTAFLSNAILIFSLSAALTHIAISC